MKIVSWNVNSIRVRLERACAWLERHEPDLVCLQETKVEDGPFPRAPFEALGYHVETYGQKTYNGVAFLAREGLVDVTRGLPGEAPDAQRRLIAGTFRGVRVIDVYVPNGKDAESEHFAFKLGWLERLRDYLAAELERHDELLVLGDFNIAPEERDVHAPELWRGKVHFHPREHEALAAIGQLGLVDLFRWHHREGGRYSWWDYRRMGFQRDAGLRIDLLLGSQSLAERCSDCEIDRAEREGEKPSDHAPVWATFEG